MVASDGYLLFVKDLLNELGPVMIRRMFGGAGIFCDGVMFALVADDVLYLKADDDTRASFEAERCAPFSYATTGGRNTIMSYWRTPERLFDEPDELVAWARRALGAARRQHAGAKSRQMKLRKVARRPTR